MISIEVGVSFKENLLSGKLYLVQLKEFVCEEEPARGNAVLYEVVGGMI